MPHEQIEADYLVVGSGAMGMAFTDVVLSEDPSARIALVDRHARPGGHWNDAYPFVSLHQPAAFYGVSSEHLGTGGAALASGAEVLAYYERVMRKFRESGRVHYFPMCEYSEEGQIASVVDPDRQIDVAVGKRRVDATYMNVQVPSICAPRYGVAEGVSRVPLNDLSKIREPHRDYVVIGAGKTGMDAVLFLLDQGVDPEHLRWVVPNDAWFLDRDQITPSLVLNFFMEPFRNILQSSTVDELFASMERDELLLRLDPTVWPTKYRCATVNRSELAALRRVRDVIRLGRIQRIDRDEIVLDKGSVPTDDKTLHVDCSADGLARRPVRPVFEEGRLTLQSMVMCQQVFSAAAIGHILGLEGSDEEKNALCGVVPHPEVPRDYLIATRGTFQNLVAWTPRMARWLRGCRLSASHHPSFWSLLRAARVLRKTIPSVFARIDEILENDPPRSTAG